MVETLITIGAIGGLTSLIYGLGRMATIRASRAVLCPVKGVPATVDFQHETTASWGAGAKRDVLRCSALAHPDSVDCGKDCLRG